jgi:hypothetical protein
MIKFERLTVQEWMRNNQPSKNGILEPTQLWLLKCIFCLVMGVQGDATYDTYGQLKGCNFVVS